MAGRVQVVVEVDPSSSSALVRVAGTASSALVGELRQVVRRVEEAVGPRVRVDLSGCDAVDPAVLALLRAERERLRRAGGTLSSSEVLLDGGQPGGASDGRPSGPPTSSRRSLRRRADAALARRTAATDVGPERSAAGLELLELLRAMTTLREEQQHGRAATVGRRRGSGAVSS
ncbi:hypothetical protein WDZ17_10745 [Pseudokineococcus basanitobsidens]|uniref:STAS domain-containing protein n=1 Tax=Pseudokineococcus basanitobsidens TaxID=1926649 RepID=A0ABU8RLD6_9ACTN